MKKLEEKVDIELGINEGLNWSICASDHIRYSGMPSERTFALSQYDGGGRFRNQMFFPAREGVIEIHRRELYGGRTAKFQVKKVTPEKIVLEYLGGLSEKDERR